MTTSANWNLYQKYGSQHQSPNIIRFCQLLSCKRNNLFCFLRILNSALFAPNRLSQIIIFWGNLCPDLTIKPYGFLLIKHGQLHYLAIFLSMYPRLVYVLLSSISSQLYWLFFSHNRTVLIKNHRTVRASNIDKLLWLSYMGRICKLDKIRNNLLCSDYVWCKFLITLLKTLVI